MIRKAQTQIKEWRYLPIAIGTIKKQMLSWHEIAMIRNAQTQIKE
jgi:hypothetical protein